MIFRTLRRAGAAFVVLCLHAPAGALAARLEARLLLPDGRPAAGYSVSIVGGAVTVPCAADGSFRLDPAPSPPFRLVAAAPNGELSAPIEVAAVPDGLVELTLSAVVRDAVTVVSGIAPGLDLLPASAAVVVSSEALEQRPPQRLVDALESVAGASKLGEGADSVPALRGLARGRTLILVDGARVTAERRAGPAATFVDPATLASIEVLRGPGSVVYGSDAFGGVLNAVTRDPDPERSLRFSLEGSVGGQPQTGASVALSLPVGAGALLVDLHGADADDGEAGGGDAIDNSSYASFGGAFRWVQPLGPGRLRVSLQADRVDDLGKAAIDSREIRAVYPREDSDRLMVAWIGAPSATWDALEASLFAGTYRVELERDRAATADADRRVDTSDTDAKDAQLRAVAGRGWAGGRLQVGLDVHSRLDLASTVGRVDYAADGATVAAASSSAAIDDARQIASGLFATWSRALAPRWSLAVGARGDRIASRNRGGFFGDRSSSDTALAGNVAVTWAPAAGWSVTAQGARGFRGPTLSDRYFRGPSGRGFVVGNPDLDPESSLQFDLAARRTLGRTALAVYAYRYEIDDLIERFRVGDDFRFRNRGQAALEGFEVEAQSRLDERWTLEGGAAWTRGRTDGGASIDDQPAPNLFAGARYADAWGYAFARLALHGEKDDPGPTEIRRGGYALVDLGGGWQISERLELRAVVRNAFDRRYSGSPDEAADVSPGRTLQLGLSGRF
ncbi:MAG: TonB-dependent receptor [Thermoanaerobaculia bacterium]|nr:TonB-dependent receptor [Thermoanaerobaculia bacterium]